MAVNFGFGNAVSKTVKAVLANEAHRAVNFIAPNYIIRATRVLYNGKLPRRGSNVEVVLTIGRPNYLEREFIKVAKKAGEPFPIKKIQLKYPPKRK